MRLSKGGFEAVQGYPHPAFYVRGSCLFSRQKEGCTRCLYEEIYQSYVKYMTLFWFAKVGCYIGTVVVLLEFAPQ